MKIEIGRTYKSQSGNFLRLESITEMMFNFILVDVDGVVIPEKRNRAGHVVLRNLRQYSHEVVISFKLIG
jgi:hypothetical protein